MVRYICRHPQCCNVLHWYWGVLGRVKMARGRMETVLKRQQCNNELTVCLLLTSIGIIGILLTHVEWMIILQYLLSCILRTLRNPVACMNLNEQKGPKWQLYQQNDILFKLIDICLVTFLPFMTLLTVTLSTRHVRTTWCNTSTWQPISQFQNLKATNVKFRQTDSYPPDTLGATLEVTMIIKRKCANIVALLKVGNWYS